MPRSLRLIVVLFLLCAASFAQVAKTEDFLKEENVAVPMRDGVTLRADVWRPHAPGKYPVLVYRTPYGRTRAPESYATFQKAAQRGYAVVIQDVRGRYGSEGEFVPYANEGRDGFDTIEWAARQPWSNGRVGTFGLSYPGAVQWLAAMESPPSLKAMVPAMTFATPRNFFYSGGVLDLSWLAWTFNNISPDVRARKDLPGPRDGDAARKQWRDIRGRVLRHLPLSTLPDLRDTAPWYYEWLKHPPESSYWDFAELQGKYGRVSAAVLHLSGWHDEAYGPDGALHNWRGLAALPGRSPATNHVLMGPWVHGVDATAATRSGAREFGPAAAIDYDQVVLRWMDRHLRGLEDDALDRQPPVRLFVMGKNEWREFDSWPPPARPTSFYLAAGSQPRRGLLSLAASAAPRAFSRYDSDPAAPLTDPHAQSYGAHDYRDLAGREDVLVFDSAPLERDLEVLGPITAEIFISLDAPDADLWVRLLDVAPDGTAYNLMSPGLDVLRASYRDPAQRELLVPGEVYKLTLSHLLTGNMFRQGHRIRVQISSAFFPHFSRNLQTGELEAASDQTRKASIRIYHDRDHPSRIILPVLE